MALTELESVPIDPIFQLLYDYRADERSEKMNLGIGLYADRQGKPMVFPGIQEAAAQLDLENFNYQPIKGNAEFLEGVQELFLEGADRDLIASQATVGGTHACRMYADLVMRDRGQQVIAIGTPTWGNHLALFKAHEVKTFDHLDETGEFHLESYKKVIQELEPGSVLLLHGGGTHNPSGVNASADQLDALIPLLQEREILVCIDWAYAGFGLGFAEDRAWVMKLWNALDDVAVGISFSKCASLYEHRTGALLVKTDQVQVLESNMQQLSREMVSMAPGFGQEVMSWVFANAQEQWLGELEAARVDIQERKQALLVGFSEKFQSLADAQGMFGLLPLSVDEIHALRKDHAVYLPDNGRINFSGLRDQDIERLGEVIRSVAGGR